MGELVISVGTDPKLLWLREAVLRKAGFRVLTVSDGEQAATEVGARDFAVLLLCYSVDGETRQKLMRKYRERCPDGRIVTIANSSLEETDADGFVYAVEGAEALIAAVTRSPEAKAS